ncbi:MAG: hypothetical protein HY362_04750 [Candidatus Aenigmarchaeota archaeon]|nr:hypothetical protein [Candidatus Aenigmarchaeota archaeon]
MGKQKPMRKQKSSREDIELIIVILFVAAIAFFVGTQFSGTKTINQNQLNFPDRDLPLISTESPRGTATINLPAVDNAGNGVVSALVVEVKTGSGKVLTDIDKLLFWTDTQQSIQTARDVAAKKTGADLSKLDIVYGLRTDKATVVGGPSAGAALTVATIAALEGKQLKKDIIITGTIETDGSVGRVGGILEKAGAAKAVGAKLFLVPKGEGIQTYVKPEENCTRQLGLLICETTYKKITVSVGESLGIDIKEVSNIDEAVDYLLEK